MTPKPFQIILGVACCMVAPLVVNAQGSPSEVSLPSNWKVGDKVEYVLVKSRERTRSGRLIKASGTTPLDVEVLEANETGYLVGWTLGVTKSDDAAANSDVVARQMSQIMAGFQQQLELDRSPSVTGVRNWMAFQEKMDETFEVIESTLKRSNVDEETLRSVSTQLKQMFSGREKINTLLVKEAQLFFFVLGGEYSEEAFEYDDLIANPFGGEPIPSKGKLRLTNVTPDGHAVIGWSQAIDQNAFASILKDMAKQLSSTSGKKLQDIDLEVNVVDNGEFVVDIETGWPVRLTHTRSIIGGPAAQSDTLVIRRRASAEAER